MEEAYRTFARGLQRWELLTQRIDFDLFHDILEQVRQRRIAEQYALELWDLFENPVKFRSRMKGEFIPFMVLAIQKTSMRGTHPDIIP